MKSSVRLYSRDDVLGQLSLQWRVAANVAKGWRPFAPVAPGGMQPRVEPSVARNLVCCPPRLPWLLPAEPEAAPDGESKVSVADDSGSEAGSESDVSSFASASGSESTDSDEDTILVCSRRVKLPREGGLGNPVSRSLHRGVWGQSEQHARCLVRACRPDVPMSVVHEVFDAEPEGWMQCKRVACRGIDPSVCTLYPAVRIMFARGCV